MRDSRLAIIRNGFLLTHVTVLTSIYSNQMSIQVDAWLSPFGNSERRIFVSASCKRHWSRWKLHYHLLAIDGTIFWRSLKNCVGGRKWRGTWSPSLTREERFSISRGKRCGWVMIRGLAMFSERCTYVCSVPSDEREKDFWGLESNKILRRSRKIERSC